MPPQPLLSKCRDATLSADYLALRQHPTLAASIAEITATWAQIECNLGVILARMLGAAARASMAMYGALKSTAQMAALQAAADATLTPERLELFGVMIAVVKRAAFKRNRVVHWLWGELPQVPNALVLTPPEAVLGLHTKNAEYLADFKAGRPVPDPSTLAPLDLSKSFVYQEKDFAEIIDELTKVHYLTASFALMLVMEDQPDGVQYQMLCNALRTDLEKARKRKVTKGQQYAPTSD